MKNAFDDFDLNCFQFCVWQTPYSIMLLMKVFMIFYWQTCVACLIQGFYAESGFFLYLNID